MKRWMTVAAVVEAIDAATEDEAIATLNNRLAAAGVSVYPGAATVAFEIDPELA